MTPSRPQDGRSGDSHHDGVHDVLSSYGTSLLSCRACGEGRENKDLSWSCEGRGRAVLHAEDSQLMILKELAEMHSSRAEGNACCDVLQSRRMYVTAGGISGIRAEGNRRGTKHELSSLCELHP